MDSNGVIHLKVSPVEYVVSDSIKAAVMAAGNSNLSVPSGMLGNVLAAPRSVSRTSVGASCGGSGEFQGYAKSRVAFEPEQIPNVAPFPLKDDGFLTADGTPLGFDFSFYGQSFSRVNIAFNGFLMFGALPVRPPSDGWSSGGDIAATAAPNNILAFAWTDWSPQLVSDAIRYETRGVAPNRRFVLQFNNVPEYHSTGVLMSQVVLSEGSNEITIYTNTLAIKNTSHWTTQGIENAEGTLAAYDSVQNAAGVWVRRVRNIFNLSNDAIRFTPISSKDDEKPLIPEVANLTANNDPGLASAVVAVAKPAATDNCSAVKVDGVRSDAKDLADPYPVGVTTINWTATDDAGNSATASQTVTVVDVEAPVWAASEQSVIQLNATSPNGAVVTFDAIPVSDNVAVTGRSCEPASGSVFHVGLSTVNCAAWDAAGNSASTSFSVNVIGAHEQIGVLMETVTNLDLPNGTSQPLLNQLKSAYAGTADGAPACKKVSDFLSMLQKKGSNLSSEEVASLTAEANRILSVMGCPPPSRATLSVPSSFQRSFQRP